MMNVIANRGNRLHAPENTRTALTSAYTSGADGISLDVRLAEDGRLVVSRDAGSNGAETLPELLDALPARVEKLIDLRPDGDERRQELVDRTMDVILERGLADEVIVYSSDPEALRLAEIRAPYLRICTLDWDRKADEQVDLMEELHADGLVVQLDSIFGRGQFNEVGERLAKLHSERDFRVGAVVQLTRDDPVFSEKEWRMLRKYAVVYATLTDSVLDVSSFTRDGIVHVGDSLEQIDGARFVHADGRALGLLSGIDGDFVAEVDYELGSGPNGTVVAMSAVNVDRGERFLQPRGAPPFAGVEHDGADGYRTAWNLGTDADSTGYGSSVGDGRSRAARLRLERRGP
jgi:glycerophosphoryl diester phosphodiesterase